MTDLVELSSRIPSPVVVHVTAHPDARFCAVWGDSTADLTAHLADLALLGLLLGTADGDAVVGDGVGVGEVTPNALTVGSWELYGPVSATVLSEEGIVSLDADELGCLAAAGLMRALADANA